MDIYRQNTTAFPTTFCGFDPEKPNAPELPFPASDALNRVPIHFTRKTVSVSSIVYNKSQKTEAVMRRNLVEDTMSILLNMSFRARSDPKTNLAPCGDENLGRRDSLFPPDLPDLPVLKHFFNDTVDYFVVIHGFNEFESAIKTGSEKIDCYVAEESNVLDIPGACSAQSPDKNEISPKSNTYDEKASENRQGFELLGRKASSQNEKNRQFEDITTLQAGNIPNPSVDALKRVHFFKQAEWIDRWIRSFGYTQAQLASLLKTSQSYVANKLRLLRFTPDEKDEILRSGLSERHARALLLIPLPKQRLLALKKIKNEGLTVAETEQMIENHTFLLESIQNLENDRQYVANYLIKAPVHCLPAASRPLLPLSKALVTSMLINNRIFERNRTCNTSLLRFSERLIALRLSVSHIKGKKDVFTAAFIVTPCRGATKNGGDYVSTDQFASFRRQTPVQTGTRFHFCLILRNNHAVILM